MRGLLNVKFVNAKQAKQTYQYKNVCTTYTSNFTHLQNFTMTYNCCCVYSVENPDDGQQICPKRVEFFTVINLRNNASRWLYYKNISRCTVL